VCRLHPAPYTSTPYTLHCTPYTLHPTLFTLHPKPYTLQVTNLGEGAGAGRAGSVSPHRFQGVGCRVQGSGFRVQGTGFGVQGSGCRVRGSWCFPADCSPLLFFFFTLVTPVILHGVVKSLLSSFTGLYPLTCGSSPAGHTRNINLLFSSRYRSYKVLEP
jgi:hypothetical protein